MQKRINRPTFSSSGALKLTIIRVISKSSKVFQEAISDLAASVDIIYLHIDLDILDASEIPGSFFEVKGGPLARELVKPIKIMVANPKVAALGIASFPTAEKGRDKSLQSTLMLIEACMTGLLERIKP